MPRAYISGKTVILFIKRIQKTPTPDTLFRAVACLDSNDFSGSKEKKVVNNKCTLGWEDGIAGNGSWQMSGSGQLVTDAAVTEIASQELAEVWANGETVEIKMANADGSYYRGGTGMITDFAESANSDDPLSFDATISGFGAPVMKKPAV